MPENTQNKTLNNDLITYQLKESQKNDEKVLNALDNLNTKVDKMIDNFNLKIDNMAKSTANDVTTNRIAINNLEFSMKIVIWAGSLVGSATIIYMINGILQSLQ